ncbi:glycosyltransferase N-terminal domain-containing protein [Maribacter sp. SA7]|uniref:3-deoxy-D-manno-octulosonic acid transferase n=1 Tax=Maribacter zhoushanensis TaxID=3030012 RepID=UPI0023EC35F5|nr:glycosyltransferase N-terminal domain-containing protein [Maribacter zhoushanensis]MDF4201949.1 glycosyltransferase N-terminal domain-containing protein [Maribacter zhoushanensis]
MYFLYNLIVISVSAILKVLALTNSKLSLFVKGRKETISLINRAISNDDKVIWIHAASLGEYEQGLPVIEKLKIQNPTHKIIISFFSPSGYEVKKNSKIADVICYLPMDTKKKVKSFLAAAHPDIAIFIKYEIWPNYLSALKKSNTPTFLISALFKPNQVYFKWYGGFMRRVLNQFYHVFVQNEKAKALLNSVGYTNVSIAGDTRFDRVAEILERDNKLDFMERFKNEQYCFVAGSTWAEDEKIIIDYINKNVLPIKFVIAPHTVKDNHIEEIIAAVDKKVIRYSEMKDITLADYDVIVIDTIGLLTKIYSYADTAYVGGGFATGLHNTLEPAVFGIPVMIGPKFEGFAEAEELVKLGGVISVDNSNRFQQTSDKCFESNDYRLNIGNINTNYIKEKAGATNLIVDKLNAIFSLKS